MTTRFRYSDYSVKGSNEAGVVFSMVSIARNQRRERICSLFSIDTESSKLRVAGSSAAAPTIYATGEANLRQSERDLHWRTPPRED